MAWCSLAKAVITAKILVPLFGSLDLIEPENSIPKQFTN
jgi:hypothetical protein